MFLNLILIAFLVTCSTTDLLFRKAYNAVTYPIIFSGIIFNTIFYGRMGLLDSLLGALLGLVLLIGFYLLGGLGAGDVKFMIAVGSLKGWNFTLFGGIYGAIIAGIAAIIIMALKGTLLKSLKKVFHFFLFLFTLKTVVPVDKESTIYLPYCFFLSLGIFIRLAEVCGFFFWDLFIHRTG
ncbi:MAG: A24 family peptidase [Elusimicrobia bacterium]|nr:A24 family peptidase [Elusimicrobiota bacterium]MBU2614940.1 A24 family peptidase [Elusimicrobiota bacterium]